jgi:hypothetical protein
MLSIMALDQGKAVIAALGIAVGSWGLWNNFDLPVLVTRNTMNASMGEVKSSIRELTVVVIDQGRGQLEIRKQLLRAERHSLEAGPQHPSIAERLARIEDELKDIDREQESTSRTVRALKTFNPNRGS